VRKPDRMTRLSSTGSPKTDRSVRSSGNTAFDLIEAAPHAQGPASGVARVRNLLLWSWGQDGAGTKITYELAAELCRLPGVVANVSAPAGSKLAERTRSLDKVETRTVEIFRGDKFTWFGKFAAASALLRLTSLVAEFRACLDALSVDVAICTMQAIWDLAPLYVLRRGNTRFVLFLHDATLHPGDAYPFRQAVMRREIAMADALIVLSEHVRHEAHSVYGYPLDRIWKIPHGAFAFANSGSQPRAFPRGRPMRLLFLGRVVAYKGLGHLLDAYHLLRARNVQVALEIAGAGDLAPYGARLKGLPDISLHNKWLDEGEIGASLRRSDVVVLPYIEASQSGIAASALTAGLPVVVTPVGGLVEQISHGKTGLIAADMSAEALADSIQSLVENPRLYEQCSAGALRHARDELGWRAIAATIAGIADEVMAMPRKGRQQ
jgi:glycosyltransferase involved in cell wall biosynthesis